MFSLDQGTISAGELVPLARLDHEDRPFYHFRRKMMSRVVVLTLGDRSLSWSDTFNRGEVFYRDITRVRLTYQPGHVMAPRYWLHIESTGAGTVRIANWGWRGLGDIDKQNEAFCGFLGVLHEKIAATKAEVSFLAGEPNWRYQLTLLVGMGCIGALLFFLAHAVASAGLGPFLIVLACLAFFGWQTWLMAVRNRPGHYSPAAIPLRLLPKHERHH